MDHWGMVQKQTFIHAHTAALAALQEIIRGDQCLAHGLGGFASLEGRCVLGADELRPVLVPAVGEQVETGDRSIGSCNDGHAILGRHWANTLHPLIDHRRRNAKDAGHVGLRPNDVARPLNWCFLLVHDLNIASLYDTVKQMPRHL